MTYYVQKYCELCLHGMILIFCSCIAIVLFTMLRKTDKTKLCDEHYILYGPVQDEIILCVCIQIWKQKHIYIQYMYINILLLYRSLCTMWWMLIKNQYNIKNVDKFQNLLHLQFTVLHFVLKAYNMCTVSPCCNLLYTKTLYRCI